jgi:hypothetical protein
LARRFSDSTSAVGQGASDAGDRDAPDEVAVVSVKDARAVDDDLIARLSAVRHRDLEAWRAAHQALELSACAVAQQRPEAAREHRGHPPRVERQTVMANRVHAPVE